MSRHTGRRGGATHRRVAVVLALLLGTALLVTVGTVPAHAQATPTTVACEYPFVDCPSPTTVPRPDPTLVLSAQVVVAGQAFSAEACGYLVGADVAFGFGGQAMGSVVAGTDGCAQSNFNVPNVGAGTYDVCVVTSGYATVCGAVRVAGTTFARGGGGVGGAGGSVARSLASTGFGLLGLVLLGVGLLSVGVVLRRRLVAR